MKDFVGRLRELASLDSLYEQVGSTSRGVLLAVRGRRQVGKSRLVDEFLRRSAIPHVFFTASRQAPDRELRLFADELRRSSHPAGAAVAPGSGFDSWEAALSLLSVAGDRPTAVVIDEFPYLLEGDDSLDATLQKVWDRVLEATPTLVVLIGSDLAMMGRLGGYGRPLFGRVRELRAPAFTPAETAALARADAAAALDAYLIVGGFPRLASGWEPSDSPRRYLARALADPASALVGHGERIVAAEFPLGEAARQVLSAIGGGQPSFTTLERTAGLPQTSLRRALDVLHAKEVVAADRPVSTKPSRLTRYRVADPYLRFWIACVEPVIGLVERGRGDDALRRVMDRWASYRGAAVEPLVRSAVEMLLPAERFGRASQVGSYWTRDGSVDVDLVGVDRLERPREIAFAGSVKWRDRGRFDDRDAYTLAVARSAVPGASAATRLVGVSRTGFSTSRLDVALSPDDLLAAWQG